MSLPDEVREHCAAIAGAAEFVRIDPGAAIAPGGIEGLDPALHYLDASPQDVARYVFILDAINFGSGWFDELGTSTDALTAQLTEHARAVGPWSEDALSALTPSGVSEVLGLPDDHELTGLYARALNDLGAWLPGQEIGDSAAGLAARLAQMPFYADAGFYKRAQITANDLVHAGVASFGDIDALTVFADNLLPHVLRHLGVLHYDDPPDPLPAGSRLELELRACTVHACELLAAGMGVPPRTLDNWLWNRGRGVPGRPHRTRTVFY